MGKIRINHEVWLKLPSGIQGKDLAYQAVLDNVNKAMIPLAQLASTCMQQIEDHNQADPSKALKTITDS